MLAKARVGKERKQLAVLERMGADAGPEVSEEAGRGEMGLDKNQSKVNKGTDRGDGCNRLRIATWNGMFLMRKRGKFGEAGWMLAR